MIECTFQSLGSNQVAATEGTDLGGFLKGTTFEACKQKCSSLGGCNSFSFCTEWGIFNNCFFKDRKLNGNEPTSIKYACQTFYKKCEGNTIFVLHFSYES